MFFKTHSYTETENIGFSLAKNIPYGKTIAMFGEMGAGKTAFTRGFARGMNIEEAVFSPTFSLVNEYGQIGNKLYHFDMYRISGWDDLYSTGFFEYLDTNASLIIEWSENIESVLPVDCIKVIIKKCDDNYDDRIIEINGCEKFEIIGS